MGDSVVSVTSGSSAPSAEMTSRLHQLEKENADLKKVTDELRALVLSLDSRVKALEGPKSASAPSAPVQPPKPAEQKKEEEEDDDDDVDLFGDDDEEDEDAERIKQERIAAYSARKSKKPVLIAKSNIILDIKPWDDETDMKELRTKCVKLKLRVYSGELPNLYLWLMASRNSRFPLLLKMTRFLLTGLLKPSRKLKIWFRVLTLLLSTKSKMFPYNSCITCSSYHVTNTDTL